MSPQGPFTRTVSVSITIIVTVKFTLTDRMSFRPIVSVKLSVTIGTMLNFDGDGHGH